MSFKLLMGTALLSLTLISACQNSSEDSFRTVPVTNNPNVVPNIVQSTPMPGVGY
jgi:hypothetical protein